MTTILTLKGHIGIKPFDSKGFGHNTSSSLFGNNKVVVDYRTFLSCSGIMKGKEFIKKVEKLAKQKGVVARVDKKRGKGSHVTLYFGEKFTIVRNPKDELKTGTLNAMLKQLGIKEDDI